MSNSPRIQIFGRVIAEKVGKNPFTCRDVPEVPAASLNPRYKYVRNLLEATE